MTAELHSPSCTASSTLSTDLREACRVGIGTEVVADVVQRIASAAARLAAQIPVSVLDDVAAQGRGGTKDGGHRRKSLNERAEQLFLDALHGSDVAAVGSDESGQPVPVTPGGSLVVGLDPIDGSRNVDIDAPVGTIFSVLPASGCPDARTAFLQAGRRQLAAGIVMYGPSTALALTLGNGTSDYILDPARGEFVTLHRRVTLPPDSREYAIDASNARHWNPGIRSYVSDLVSGSSGPRQRDFSMRWMASLVAETYRILQRGGIYLYPADTRPGYARGRIRLVYEASPVAFLCEQAGGAATDGRTDVLDLVPGHLHQSTPFVFGSRTKVARVRRYLLDPPTTHEESPLFSNRGLFRT